MLSNPNFFLRKIYKLKYVNDININEITKFSNSWINAKNIQQYYLPKRSFALTDKEVQI